MSLSALDTALTSILKHDPRADVSLMLGDCRELMNDFPSNSVHLIITDPPYFLDGMDGGWNARSLNVKKGKAGVVGGLPTGMRFDKRQGENLQAFIQEVARQAIRVLVPGGFFISFAAPRLYHRMAVAMDDAGFEIRDMYAWHYRKGQTKAFTQDHFVKRMKISAARKTELIKSMGGRKTPQLRPQFEPMAVAQKPRDGTHVENWQKWQTGLVDLKHVRINGHIPGTVFSIEKPQKDTYNTHLTVKPVKLIETLICLFTTERQVVLDPFVGSGTSLLAARNVGRSCIGIEVNEEYYNIACKRLASGKKV